MPNFQLQTYSSLKYPEFEENSLFELSDTDSVNSSENLNEEYYQLIDEKWNRFSKSSARYKDPRGDLFAVYEMNTQEDYQNFIRKISGKMIDLNKEGTEKEIIKSFCRKIRNHKPTDETNRRKILRKVNETHYSQNAVYCLEPWFRKYLSLFKFRQQARAIIAKNRLIKNLEKLKKLNPLKILELELCQNKSLADPFTACSCEKHYTEI